MEDDAILDRLATDIRFRALATRLLQRYGYLTPQLNPLSPSAREQDLLLRAKAERLARASATTDTDLGPESETPEAECEPGGDNPGCLTETSSPAARWEPEPESSETACGPGEDNVPCPEPATPPAPYPPNPALSVPFGTGTPLPENQQPDLAGATLMTASAVSTTGQPRTRTQPGGLRSEDLADVTGGIPAVLPENPSRPADPPLGIAAPAEGKFDPRAGRDGEFTQSLRRYLLRFTISTCRPRRARGVLSALASTCFSRDPGSAGIPMDLPAGPEYVLGPGDGLTIDLWGGVSQRLFRTVDREGRLSLPEVGPLLVSGKTLGEVQEVVQRILRTQYRDVSADLSLGRLRTVRVYVVGEVVSPGAYDISSLSTPLNALFAAGGVTSRGSLRHLRHSRGQPTRRGSGRLRSAAARHPRRPEKP